MATSAHPASAEAIVVPLVSRVLSGGLEELASFTLALNRERVSIRTERQNLESMLSWTADDADGSRADLEARIAIYNSAIHLLDRMIVSAERLNRATGRKAGFEALHDVLANAVGIENFAIYEVDPLESRNARLVAYCSDDVPPTSVGCNDLASVVLRTGRRAFEEDFEIEPSSLPQIMCSPLWLGRQIKFLLIAIHLLPQIGALRPRDIPIFELIERFAASVLLRESKSGS